MTYRRFLCADDFKPETPTQDPNRRVSIPEMEMAFRYVCINFKKQWKLTGKGHVRRVALKPRYVPAALNGSNSWVYLKLDGWAKAYLFPFELVQAVCNHLEIDTARIVPKDYTKVYPAIGNPKGPKYYTYYLKHIHKTFDPEKELQEKMPDLFE